MCVTWYELVSLSLMWLDNGAASAPFSHTSVDVLTVYCHSAFKCLCVVVLLWLVLVRVKLPGAGSGGCWPAVSSYVAVIRDVLPTACRDSWPCYFSLLLRVESAASPQRSHASAAFKKSYTPCVTPVKPYLISCRITLNQTPIKKFNIFWWHTWRKNSNNLKYLAIFSYCLIFILRC